MDKNGKIGGKVSIIDILVVVLVVAVIVGIVARYGSSVTGAVKSNKQFEYVLKVESVRQYTVDALEKKGKVTDKKSEKDLGEIVDVQVENATLQSTTASGELKNPELPGISCYVLIKRLSKSVDVYREEQYLVCRKKNEFIQAMLNFRHSKQQK